MLLNLRSRVTGQVQRRQYDGRKTQKAAVKAATQVRLAHHLVYPRERDVFVGGTRHCLIPPTKMRSHQPQKAIYLDGFASSCCKVDM